MNYDCPQPINESMPINDVPLRCSYTKSARGVNVSEFIAHVNLRTASRQAEDQIIFMSFTD
jgi:hypothetical protein